MTVVAKNIGRLGNNMFQIAAAIGYARKYGYQWGVDSASGTGEPYSAIHKVFPNLPKVGLGGVNYHEHPHGQCPIHNCSYDICHFDYHEIPNLGPNVFLTGFFQSWKYFDHCKDEVKSVFQLPHVPGYEDCVSIHVRRGDYVQYSGSFPPITFEYIDDSMELINKKVGQLVRGIFFSDDIQWCKDYFGKYTSVEFSEGRTEAEDMALMASCGHHIIANSSFSWWGSYLGHNAERIVISPAADRSNWFGPTSGIQKDMPDLLPPEWTQIKFR